MSLKDQINSEFARITQLGVPAGTATQLAIDSDTGRLECELTELDKIGCSFAGFVFRSERFASKSVDELKRLSESLAAKLSYLLEPIRPVEVDRGECVVQMRSNPPQKDDDGTSYYELLAKSGQLSLCRFNKPRGDARRVIPAQVTREVFHRLAHDFASVG